MSSAGQVIGGVVGAVVGYFVGNPVLGAQIGMAIGGAIDPPKGPTINGPRLEDMSVQTSTYGAFIPRNYGTIAQNGNIFWLQGDKLTEVKTTDSGGKGGPTQETNTWSYYATFAVGLCQGPIAGVRRIWVGADLFYDAGSSDITTVMASNQSAQLFTIYTGTDTQQPDPLIQADKGIANTPAYRGLAYIVFDALPLAKYSNSLMGAQIKVELLEIGTTDYVVATNPLGGSSTSWKSLAFNGFSYAAISTSAAATSFNGVLWNTHEITISDWAAIAWDGKVFCAVSNGYSRLAATSTDGAAWSTNDIPDPDFTGRAAIGWGKKPEWAEGIFFTPGWSSAVGYISNNGTSWSAVSLPVSGSWRDVAFNGTVFCCIGGPDTTNVITSPDGVNWTLGAMPAALSWRALAWNGVLFCAVANSTSLSAFATSPDGFTWSTVAPPAGVSWVDIAWNGSHFCAVADPSSVAAISPDGVTWTTINLPAHNWVSVTSGDGVFVALAGNGTAATIINPITGSARPLSGIISAECLTSNLLTSSDIDVTELTDTVRGYRVSAPGAIRGAIEPLRAAWPFDVVQAGYKIKFKKRGSASVATIPASLLDARAAGEAPGIQITDSREMDLVLPKKVGIKYLDITREYDTNEQYSERINTDAVNERSVDMPMVFSATEAAQKAEMLLYMYWLERYDISLNLPPAYANLEPADVITVLGENATYELRLTSTNTLPDGRIECRAKYNSAAIYAPSAVGEEGQSAGGLLTLSGPSVYQLLDIPLLKDTFDLPGFPVAMTGYLAGWPGGVLYRSDDGGQTLQNLSAFPSPGTVIGYATTSLATHGGTVLDKASALSVRVYSGALSSVSEAQMFAGQNWFAYGVDGRWEIIAAQNCVLQADGSYIMSDFLRGQNGTEWATGVHVANDKIVSLNTATLQFITVNASSIGQSRDYRAITNGKTLDSDANRAFTYTGANLECLSPVHLTGNRHPTTNDWTLTWVRRSRFAGWRDYVDAALGETVESYEIEIYSSSAYTTLKRTLTATTQAVTYTSADQVTDFAANQATLYLKIYQLSATVGRGYPLTQSITR